MAKIAYQLYSAREEAEKDLRSVLRKLASMEYDGVEFAGFYGHSAQDVRALMDETGLEAVSSHVPFQAIEEDMFSVISHHLTVGCKWIAVPYLLDAERPGKPGFARVIAVIHRFARLCREAGIQLLYHNHDFEFATVSGAYALDFLYEAVPANLLETEIDTCWVKYSGLDPAEYVTKYAGRCPIVHIKDYICDEPTAPCQPLPASFRFRPVGMGCQNVPAIVGAAVASGAKWLVVEQDYPRKSPMEDAGESLRAIRAAL